VGQIDATATHLSGLGIKRGNRVALVLRDGPKTVTAFLGIASAAICAPLNPAYSPWEFENHLSDLKAARLIVEAGNDLPAVTVARSLGMGVVELAYDLEAAAGVFSLP